MPRELRRAFSIKLTHREHALLLKAAAAQKRSRHSILIEVLRPLLTELETRYGPGLDSPAGLDQTATSG